MTQLAYIPAFEYSRRGVLGLLGGAVWQLHTTPKTRVRQGWYFGSISGNRNPSGIVTRAWRFVGQGCVCMGCEGC